VVLAPGAGSSMESPLLVALGRQLAAAGYMVATFDFPYRAAGRRVPDRAPVLIDCWQAVLDAIVGDDSLAPPWVVVGGRSMGGRMASLWLAEGRRPADLVRGLLLLGYPLHPARDPTRLRSAHLGRVRVPALFVQGTRDALATPSLLQPIVAAMPKGRIASLADADHSYHVPKRSGRDDAAVQAEILTIVRQWLDTLAAPGLSTAG